MFIDSEWFRERLLNGCSYAIGDIGDIGVGNHNYKLVTPLARNGVTRPDTGDEPIGSNLEQFIANIVSQAVVDKLEIVQIYKKNRHLMAVALRHEQSLMDTVDKKVAIRQTSKTVVVGLIFQLGFITFPLGNIFKGFDDGQQFPFAVTNRSRIEG